MRLLETVAKSKKPNRLRAAETKLVLDRYERQDQPQITCVSCGQRKPKGVEVSGRKGTDIYTCDACVCQILYQSARKKLRS